MSYIYLPENEMELKTVEYDEQQFLQDREREIQATAENVIKVNTIFSDLAKLVANQQENIDDIESNINDSLSKTEEGVNQLTIAKRHQKMRNNCFLYVLCIAIFFLFMIVLYIFLV